jgi:phenylpropionate dioxygenase-like ring-hydroxylating dioxygenase large terminal subunit
MRGYPAEGRSVSGSGQGRVRAFRAQERYGLIWAALEEPRWPLPEVPELENGAWAVVAAGPYRWRCDAARQVENFTDFGHFPWVHPGLLGDPDRPVVPPYQVHTDGHVLRHQIVRTEAPNTEDFPVFGNKQAGPPERRSRYELHLPYTIGAAARPRPGRRPAPHAQAPPTGPRTHPAVPAGPAPAPTSFRLRGRPRHE